MTVAAVRYTRWQRAEQIDPASIQPLGHDTYLVPSRSGDGNYTVSVTLDHTNNIAALLHLPGLHQAQRS